MRKIIAVALALASLIPTYGRADPLYVVRPIPGYVCMDLTLSAEALRDFNNLPRIFAAPSAAGQPVAVATPIVITRSPLNVRNGFAEVMQLDGDRGWVKRDALQSYSSASNLKAKCQPVLLSNGKPGVDAH